MIQTALIPKPQVIIKPKSTHPGSKVLFQSINQVWQVVSYEQHHPNNPDGYFIRLAVIGEYKNGETVIEYPIRYYNGQIGYDNPLNIPEYVRNQVRNIYNNYPGIDEYHQVIK